MNKSVKSYQGKDSKYKKIHLYVCVFDDTNLHVLFHFSQVSDPTARSLQVHNLKPYTHYRLRITAENIVGRSGPSEPSRLFQTIQDAPGAPPGNVTVRALNATALRVSWTVCIYEYVLVYLISVC